MLECLDFESRRAILGLIYDDYKKEKSKHVTYGIASMETIADWENFRYKWLQENLLSKIEKAKIKKTKKSQ